MNRLKLGMARENAEIQKKNTAGASYGKNEAVLACKAKLTGVYFSKIRRTFFSEFIYIDVRCLDIYSLTHQ